MTGVSLLAGLVPVAILLAGMVALDSYQLVPVRSVLRSILFGVVAAAVAWGLHALVLDATGITRETLFRWVAPPLEEALKLAWVLSLIRRGRVGFPVDAAIHGFAVGAGFAMIENAYYAGTLGDSSLALWIVRGLGTALMHGGATAVAGILAHGLHERSGGGAAAWFVPGWLAATAFHASFNQLPFPPLVVAACVVVAVPVILVATYELSERQTRRWLGTTMDRDVELLERIREGTIADTPVGRYLTTLRERFPGPVVADMLCLLEIHSTLAMRAKGMLIVQAAGLTLPPDPELAAHLREWRFLERSIGPTGKLALAPFLARSGRERWQIAMLEKQART